MGRTVLVCLLLVTAVLAVYWQTTGFGFTEFDDGEYVRDNPAVQQGLTVETVRWAFTDAYHSNWHPVTWISWLIDVDIADGVHPGFMHFTNVVIHLLNALLLFGVLRRMTGDSGFWPSALVAGLFAVHPIHVESVAWISERKDVLCGMFWMLSIWAYLYYTRRPNMVKYLLLLLCFAMGLMSKGMMVTLPGVLLLLDWWPLRKGLGIGDSGLGIGSGERPVHSVNPQSPIHNPKSFWILLLEKIPLLLLGIGLSIAIWMIQRPMGKLEEGVWIPMSQRLSNGALAYVRYLGTMFWPGDLAVLYPNPNLIGDAWPAWALWGAIGVLIAMTVLVCVLRRRRPWLMVGWLWFIGTMLPVLGLVQFGRQSMADRYAYIPLIGLYIAIAWESAEIIRRRPRARFIIAPAMVMAVAALGIAAHRQAALWKDSRVLFQHAIDVTDRNWVMHRNLAGLLEADGRTEEAFAHMDEAVSIFPDCAWLHDHYGAMLAKEGRWADAQGRLQRAIDLDPQLAQAHLNLGVVFSMRGQYDAAMRHTDRARQLDSSLADRCDALVADIQRKRGAARPMSRRTTMLIGAALVLAVFIVYCPTLGHGFVDFDDPEYARDNPQVRAGLTRDGMAWAFTTRYIANWHPLTWLSLMLDAEMYGVLARLVKRFFSADAQWLYPRVFHFTNLALHSVNVLLVFGLLKRMTGFVWRSAMVAALFAVHPMHVESVAWVAERKDVLSTCFGLLTIHAYLSFVKWNGLREYVIMAILFACSLMSKAMLVTLPCALLLLDYWPLGRLRFAPRTTPAAENFGPQRSIGRLMLEKVPLLAVAAAVSAVTWGAQRGVNELQEGDWVPPDLAAANAVVSYARYLGKLVWPVDLAALYPHPSLVGGATWPAWMIIGSIALLAAMSTAALLLARRRPWFIVGWLWFLGMIVPVVGFVQVGRQAMADRYAYVPFLGLYIIVVWGVSEALQRARTRIPLAPILSGATLLLLGSATLHQVRYWSDSVTLFQHAIDVTPDNWLVHNNLAGVLNRQAVLDREQGREVEAEAKWDRAATHLDAALGIYPDVAWLHNHYGAVLGLRGRMFEAQKRFECAIELDPKSHEYRVNRGLMLQRRGFHEEAIVEYRQAISLKSDYVPAIQSLGLALAESGRFDEAVSEMEKARKANPHLADQVGTTLAEIDAKRRRSSPPASSRPQ